MSDFVKKLKDEAKAVSAAIDNELTVLEGVDGGYDPLAEEDESPKLSDEKESGQKQAAEVADADQA